MNDFIYSIFILAILAISISALVIAVQNKQDIENPFCEWIFNDPTKPSTELEKILSPTPMTNFHKNY